MLKSYIVAASALVFVSLPAHAQSQNKACDMYVNFETSQEMAMWRAVNDGVMGGLSSGGAQFDDGNMVFEGQSDNGPARFV